MKAYQNCDGRIPGPRQWPLQSILIGKRPSSGAFFCPLRGQKNRAFRSKSSEAPMRFLWAFRYNPLRTPSANCASVYAFAYTDARVYLLCAICLGKLCGLPQRFALRTFLSPTGLSPPRFQPSVTLVALGPVQQLENPLGAQGIAAEILLAQPKDWSGKPGFWRGAPKMRPNSDIEVKLWSIHEPV
jgi:hypothetical protein